MNRPDLYHKTWCAKRPLRNVFGLSNCTEKYKQKSKQFNTSINSNNTTKYKPFYLDLLHFLRKLITGKPKCNHVFSHKSVTTILPDELPVIESYDECVQCKKRINVKPL